MKKAMSNKTLSFTDRELLEIMVCIAGCNHLGMLPEDGKRVAISVFKKISDATGEKVTLKDATKQLSDAIGAVHHGNPVQAALLAKARTLGL